MAAGGVFVSGCCFVGGGASEGRFRLSGALKFRMTVTHELTSGSVRLWRKLRSPIFWVWELELPLGRGNYCQGARQGSEKIVVEQACDSIWIFEVDLQKRVFLFVLPNPFCFFDEFACKKAGYGGLLMACLLFCVCFIPSDEEGKGGLAAAKPVHFEGLGTGSGAVLVRFRRNRGTSAAVVMVPGRMWRPKRKQSVPDCTSYSFYSEACCHSRVGNSGNSY